MQLAAYTIRNRSFRGLQPRALALSLGASIAVHIAALLLMPEMVRHDGARVETLDVTIVKQEPSRVIAAQPLVPPPARKIEKPQPQPRTDPAPRRRAVVPPPQPRVETPVLALPEAAQQQPRFAISQPEPQPRSPVPEAKPEAARRQDVARPALAASKGEAPSIESSAPVTPPSFNAAYLRNPAPRYPVTARRNGEQGTVTLKVLVTREGFASSVSVEKTSGSAALDQAAADAVRSWRFAPARQGAQPVEAWVLVPIVFKLEGTS